MTKYHAIIDIPNSSPENVEHAQHLLDNWTRFNPLEIEVWEVIPNE